MQYVNDDMDELFRRAAEDYPLDTTTGDWSKVLNVLQNNEDAKGSRDHRGKYLWLLLLLPLGWICNQYGMQGNSGKEKPLAEEKIAADKNQNRTVFTKPSLETTQYDQVLPQFKTQDRTAIDEPNASVKKLNSFVTSSKPDKSFLVAKEKFKESHSVTPDASTSNELTPSDFVQNTIQNNSRSFASIELLPLANNHQHGFAFLNDKSSVLSNEIKDEPSKTIASSKSHKRFYIGIETGLDATTVKFQKIKNAGSGYGILLGYDVNKKWSIETGIFNDKKLYYSDGQYFDQSKIYVPTNSEITNINGDCRMFEVPVVLKYNISSSKKSSWFVTGGASSYFMKKEDYAYDYYYYSSGNTVTHYKSYLNSSKSFFSVLQLTGGYSHSIGKFADLRLEPYLKVPLKQVGIGKLPLLSTGLNIGITKKLF